MRTRKLRSRTSLIQIVSICVAVVLGAFIFATKVAAQTKGGAAGPRAVMSLDAGTPAKEANNAPAAPPDAGQAASSREESDAAPSPLDDTVIQTEEDFPQGMSAEEKDAIGTGKVPIHREGPYRSPFANPKYGGPATVKVGMVLSEVRGYDIQTGTFDTEFFLSLTADKELPPINLAFTNGHGVDCKAMADVPTFKFYRCSGSFTSEVDLRKYPFDTQYLTIAFEDQLYGADTLVFVPDQNRTSLDEGFRIAGYGVASVGAHAYKHLYPPRFDRDDLYVSRYKFVLGIDRFGTAAALSVYLPAFVIVIISLMGLWCPPDELEVRSNAGAPMLAAAVLFHYGLMQSLPATGYLTAADKLMLGVYVSLLLNMASTWSFLIVDEERLDAVFKFWRAWLPIITAAVMVAAVVV
jgi:hypothetical protein